MAGNAYGARDGRRLRSLGRTFLPLEVGLMLLSGGTIFLFALQLVGQSSRDPQVTKLSIVFSAASWGKQSPHDIAL